MRTEPQRIPSRTIVSHTLQPFYSPSHTAPLTPCNLSIAHHIQHLTIRFPLSITTYHTTLLALLVVGTSILATSYPRNAPPQGKFLQAIICHGRYAPNSSKHRSNRRKDGSPLGLIPVTAAPSDQKPVCERLQGRGWCYGKRVYRGYQPWQNAGLDFLR